MIVVRFDTAAGPLERPRRLADGTAIYHGRAARTGEHRYSWGVERRDVDELASIASQLGGKPLVVQHPATLLSKGGIAPTAGSVRRAEVRGDHVEVEVHVNRTGVAAIERGLRELSLGYETNAVGGRQTETRVDHLALVSAARCGASCSVRTDCDGESSCGCADRSASPSPALQVNQQLGAMRLGA